MPITYPQAKSYLIELGVWHRNFKYYEGWVVLDLAQREYNMRKDK